MSRIRNAAILFALLAAAATAQVSATVAPQQAPVGNPIAVTIANDTAATIFTGVCPFTVRTQGGTPVYTPFCIAIVVPVNPGTVFTTYWNQVNDANQQVPAGIYLVDVLVPGGGLTTVSVTITNGVGATIAPLGPIRIGTTRQLDFESPADANRPYVAAASFPPLAGGIVTCGGLIPLQLDAVFTLSTSPNPIFLNFSGNLNGVGATQSPTVVTPNLPQIVGTALIIDYVVLDLSAPCVVRRIAQALPVLIL